VGRILVIEGNESHVSKLSDIKGILEVAIALLSLLALSSLGFGLAEGVEDGDVLLGLVLLRPALGLGT